MIAIVAVIALYQSIKKVQDEKQQNELLAVQMRDIRRHLEQVENLYQDIRGIRHDMANHLLTLERLYGRDKAEEARDYSARLQDALSQGTGDIRSGNPVTDVILQGFKKEAEKRKIRFRTDFQYPAGSRIDAFDFSVILNNALQNALENTEESEISTIRISSCRRDNAYMIEVGNSFAGELQWDVHSGLPATSKGQPGDRQEHGQEQVKRCGRAHGYGQAPDDSQIHGYGLANIRRIARKYSGDIAIDLRDGEFCLVSEPGHGRSGKVRTGRRDIEDREDGLGRRQPETGRSATGRQGEGNVPDRAGRKERERRSQTG